jgi:hypothetical protein
LKNPLSIAALVVALLPFGCAGVTDSDDDVTESFSGTLQLQSSLWHEFSVEQEGTVSVTLASLASSATSVGLAIGNAENGCQRLTWNDTAQAGAVLYLDAEVGDYCVMLYDSGRLTEAASYTVSVTHP